MSRIPPVEDLELPLQAGPGAATMSTLFSVMAHRPELARQSMQLLETAMRSGTVDSRLKELLAVRVSQVNHCFYWMAAHTALARQLGVSEALLDALYHIDEHRHLFTEREVIALRFAEIMTTGAREVDEALWDELQVHFDDGEIVEIATVIGLFNFFNRFADALRILPPEDSAAREWSGMATSEEKFAALIEDLHQLAAYLHGRGDKTLNLSKQFEENAKKDSANRDFDLRQATMLDYQHHIWHEIGNMVEKLIKQHEK